MTTISLEDTLRWPDVAAISEGAGLSLAPPVRERVRRARAIVESLVDRGTRAYGVNTGVGALCDVVVDRAHQRQLSRNLLMSHACGVGAPLPPQLARAIMTAEVNNLCHGYSGVRLELIEQLVALLETGVTPVVPSRGSVGYLSHMAHISLVLIGQGRALLAGREMPGLDALRSIGREPLVLEAKEGLSLVNGTACGTGLSSVAVARAHRLLGWADAIAAMSFENLRCDPSAFAAEPLALRKSPGLQMVGARLRSLLQDSAMLAAPTRTQDALSLRAVPHVHGAARDTFDHSAGVVDGELASVTDNPVVTGTPEEPRVHSQAHAVGASLALGMDALGVAVAEIGSMAERRLDRMLNPLLSGLPAFLARDSGVASGFMIAQYTTVALVAENRRLGAPASLDAGVTSALQEDHLSHATAAALQAIDIEANTRTILAIELLAACQAYDLQPGGAQPAPALQRIRGDLRSRVGVYSDDRPLADDIRTVAEWIASEDCPIP